jgi:hypothetical protein
MAASCGRSTQALGVIGAMADSRTNLEQRALRKVRALFEALERRDRKGQWHLVLLLVLPTVLLLAALALFGPGQPTPAVADPRTSCENVVWGAWLEKEAAREREIALARPEAPAFEIYREVQRERPEFIAAGLARCPAAKSPRSG